jgi:bacterioferritin
LSLLATKMREEMSEELGHSEEYMSRILFLNGSPQLTMAKTPARAPSLKEMFESDLADEKEAIEFYTKASMQASEDRDIGTRTLFERIALDEEQHMGWLELQLDLLHRMGEPAYTSKHMPAPAADAP